MQRRYIFCLCISKKNAFILSLHLINSLVENRILVCKKFPLVVWRSSLLHGLLVSNFALEIFYAIFCMWPFHQSSRIFFVSRIFKFHDYELWNQPFFIYYAGHLSPQNTEPHAFLFCMFFSSVISSVVSSPPLSLYIFWLSCYNQKLIFLNKLSKFSSYFFHGHIFMFLIWFLENFLNFIFQLFCCFFFFTSVVIISKNSSLFFECLFKIPHFFEDLT